MKSITEICYYAASYSRLSKDDGDKAESDSIKNQKELIRNFQKNHPEIKIAEEYSDDGFSGVDFERPAFKQMLEDIKTKKINCIIVKDLSRFGRNYIETGKYIEQIFPFLEVRFIAINDNYDSVKVKNQGDDIILPFKNLINDIYCRDISIKVRSNLNAKRRKGDYVGAFAPYGYKKAEENKNQLVIDEPAAKVVKRVYKLKIDGISNQDIARTLNEEGIPAPYEYKKHTPEGRNYQPSFHVAGKTKWSVTTIIRILENEVYLGHLLQGKSTRPNYKVKEQIDVKSDEWIRVEHTHEAILSQSEYDLVQRLLMIDTRRAPGQNKVYLFSGVLYCAKCGESLVRRPISSEKGKYEYYGCYTKDRKMKCKGISIRESAIETAVLQAIRKHIELIIEMDKLYQFVDQIPIRQSEVKTLDEQLQVLGNNLTRYKMVKASLYETFHEGLINQEEYLDLKSIYDKEEKEIEYCIHRLTGKRKRFLEGKSDNQQFVQFFKKHRNINSLDRRTLVMLVYKIYVSSNKKIKVCFSYQNEFEEMRNLINQVEEVI